MLFVLDENGKSASIFSEAIQQILDAHQTLEVNITVFNKVGKIRWKNQLKNEKLHNDRIYDVTSLSKLSVEQIQIITHILLVYDILKWLCDKC